MAGAAALLPALIAALPFNSARVRAAPPLSCSDPSSALVLLRSEAWFSSALLALLRLLPSDVTPELLSFLLRLPLVLLDSTTLRSVTPGRAVSV